MPLSSEEANLSTMTVLPFASGIPFSCVGARAMIGRLGAQPNRQQRDNARDRRDITRAVAVFHVHVIRTAVEPRNRDLRSAWH
jgi:hypothetical protein